MGTGDERPQVTFSGILQCGAHAGISTEQELCCSGILAREHAGAGVRQHCPCTHTDAG